MASMVAVLLKNKTGTAYRLFTYVANATVTLGVFGDSASSPWPQVPPRRVAELRSTNRSHPSQSLTYSYNTCFQFGFVQYSGLFVQGRSRDPFGASTNIWNNLPQFPKSYTATWVTSQVSQNTPFSLTITLPIVSKQWHNLAYILFLY